MAVNGIKDLGGLAMLLCQSCHDNNVRDKFVRSFTQSNLVEKIESLDLNDKLLNMEQRLTEIVDRKIDEALKNTCEKVEKTYSSVLSTNLKTEKAKIDESQTKPSPRHNIHQSFRIQGIREDPAKSKAENLVPTCDEVNKMMDTLGLQPKPQIVEMKRMGKFDNARTKPRPLLVTLSTEHEVSLLLATARRKRDELSKANLYLLPALSREDAIRENQILKKRRELINNGVEREKLSVRNLELFLDGEKVEVSSTDSGGPPTLD